MNISPPAPSSSRKAQLVARASHVSRLRHPNLVRMLPLPGGAGFSPILDDSRSLAELTHRGSLRRFELAQTVRMLLDVLRGLSALHALSLDGEQFVHGRVAPEHIYVDGHGSARLVPLLNSHLMPDAPLDSNGYVAPELLLGDAVDTRADLFGIGVMLWEAISGRRLFVDTSVDGVIATMVGGKIPPLTPPARASWAAPLCAVALRAIAASPADRYASALELASAISVAGGLQLAAVTSSHERTLSPPAKPHRPVQARAVTPSTMVVDVAPRSSRAAPPSSTRTSPPQQQAAARVATPPPLPASARVVTPPPLPATAGLVTPPPLPVMQPATVPPVPSTHPGSTTRPVAAAARELADSSSEDTVPNFRRAKRGRGWLALVAVVPLAVFGALRAPELRQRLPAVSFQASRSAASETPRGERAAQPAAAAAAPAAAVTPLPAPAPVSAAAPAAATDASPTPAVIPQFSAMPSAAAIPAASAPPSASATAIAPTPRQVVTPARQRKAPAPKPASSDYGI